MSVGYTYEGLKIRKGMGNERVKKHQYKEALADFQMVVENTFVTDDRKAALKLGSYNSIALCYLELGELENARNAVVEAFSIFDMMRPNEFEKTQHKKNDILIKPFHTTIIRLGQIEEKKGEYLTAINHYRQANIIFPNGEGTKKINECMFNNYGVPKIDLNDKRLMPFSDLYKEIFEKTKIIKIMKSSLKKISERKFTKDDLEYMDKMGIVELFLGIVQIYIDSEDIVDVSLAFVQFFMKYKLKCGWKNIRAIDKVLAEHKDNQAIAEDIISIFDFCPKDLFSHFANKDSILNLIDLFKVEFENDECYNKLFLILFRIIDCKNNGIFDIIKNTNILENIMKFKTKNAFFILTKLSFNEELANKIKEGEVIEWVFSMLQENVSDNDYIDGGLVILCRLFKTTVSESTPENKEFANKCVENVVPVLMRNSKNIEIIRDVFAILNYAIPYSLEKIKSFNLINFASLMISLHANKLNDSMLFLKFIYKSGKYGLIDQIKEIKGVLPTIMKLLEKYPKNRKIVERTVCLAVNLDHPNKAQLLRAAIVQFPQSSVLKPYAYLLKETINKELKQMNK